jgi:TPR repeat protein
MYQKGQGVDQSYEREAEYYEAAARQGDAGAQSNLGILYVKHGQK